MGKKRKLQQGVVFFENSIHDFLIFEKETLNFYIFSTVVTRIFFTLHMGVDVFLLEFTPGPNGYLLEEHMIRVTKTPALSRGLVQGHPKDEGTTFSREIFRFVMMAILAMKNPRLFRVYREVYIHIPVI